MKGGLVGLMKQAQKMQTDYQTAQEELARMEIVGESGAGMVKVMMTGRHDVLHVDIDANLMSEDKEMMEDLVAAAVNDAVHKVDKISQERLSGLTGGMTLPEGFKMPF